MPPPLSRVAEGNQSTDVTTGCHHLSVCNNVSAPWFKPLGKKSFPLDPQLPKMSVQSMRGLSAPSPNECKQDHNLFSFIQTRQPWKEAEVEQAREIQTDYIKQ